MTEASAAQSTIGKIVPYIHVADVQGSIDFYSMLGMECRARFGPEGDPYWASMRCPAGELMLGKADGPIDPRIQATMFYVYVPDLAATRHHLIKNGLVDGGKYEGGKSLADPFPKSGIVFEPTFPHYLPEGEMRVHDPDGYVVLVAHLSETVR